MAGVDGAPGGCHSVLHGAGEPGDLRMTRDGQSWGCGICGFHSVSPALEQLKNPSVGYRLFLLSGISCLWRISSYISGVHSGVTVGSQRLGARVCHPGPRPSSRLDVSVRSR